MNKAVVLLSGGMDSATTLAVAKSEGYHCFALSFRYGQSHSPELKAAKKIAESMNLEKHLIFDLDLSAIGGSALTDDIEIPKNRTDFSNSNSDIPVTYVPARNIIFLSLALSWAETLNAQHIFIGVNVQDYSGYPDCRDEFIKAFEKTANIGTKAGISGSKFHIHTPLINLSKAEIIKRGIQLGVDFRDTLSCYDPSSDGKACGKCDSCLIRKKGFKEAGIKDPTLYKE
ncbi:MAG: 7-cyano-7-deazaguanine synthase QueC [bacterium]